MLHRRRTTGRRHWQGRRRSRSVPGRAPSLGEGRARHGRSCAASRTWFRHPARPDAAAGEDLGLSLTFWQQTPNGAGPAFPAAARQSTDLVASCHATRVARIPVCATAVVTQSLECCASPARRDPRIRHGGPWISGLVPCRAGRGCRSLPSGLSSRSRLHGGPHGWGGRWWVSTHPTIGSMSAPIGWVKTHLLPPYIQGQFIQIRRCRPVMITPTRLPCGSNVRVLQDRRQRHGAGTAQNHESSSAARSASSRANYLVPPDAVRMSVT